MDDYQWHHVSEHLPPKEEVDVLVVVATEGGERNVYPKVWESWGTKWQFRTPGYGSIPHVEEDVGSPSKVITHWRYIDKTLPEFT